MINPQKENCCGCSACLSVCPKQCIKMIADEEGFSYPHVEASLCISCGLCDKTCPFINPFDIQPSINTYAARSNDVAIQKESSSGGLFTELAIQVLNRGGYVVGAAFDSSWNVKHIVIQKPEELDKLRGSKYVQSDVEGIYREIKIILEEGKEVLFTGTPCQIAGLKHYLRKDYTDLLSVEIVCHGVPSPKVWADFKNSIEKRYKLSENDFARISFRDKKRGWSSYGFSIATTSGKDYYESRDNSIYLQGYLTNTFLRPSCYHCKAKSGRSGADIALGDYWGVKFVAPEAYDKLGVNAVVVYTKKGEKALATLPISKVETPYNAVVKSNPMLEDCTLEPKDRNVFWTSYKKVGVLAIEDAIDRSLPPFSQRLKQSIKTFIKKVLCKE